VKVKHSASYSGAGNSSYTLDVGTSGSPGELISGVDVFTAPGATVFSTNSVVASWDHASTTNITITGTGDVEAGGTGGTADVWLLVSTAN
jgi:hypothetical protein